MRQQANLEKTRIEAEARAREASQAAAAAAEEEAQRVAEAAAQKAADDAMKADGALNNDAIVEMTQEKVPARLILSQIFNATKTQFDLTPKEIIRLTKAGVSPDVVEQMRNPKRPVPVQTASAPRVPSAPGATPPATPVAPSIPKPNATPVAVPINGAPTPTAIPEVNHTPTPTPAAGGTTVSVPDAMPFRIAAANDIRNDAAQGTPLKFTVMEDFKVNGTVVLAKGAGVFGEITQSSSKGMFKGAKLSFKLIRAEGAGGQDVAVRALGARNKDGVTQRPVETNAKTGNKDVAAAQGTEYVGYIDGAQTVSVPR
jgi:hypothetical protein